MIDDCEGLFETAYEAMQFGKKAGRAEVFTGVMDILRSISAKYEPNDDPAKFHCAQECCREIRMAYARYLDAETAVSMPVEGSA